jgi:hypothetical protein
MLKKYICHGHFRRIDKEFMPVWSYDGMMMLSFPMKPLLADLTSLSAV